MVKNFTAIVFRANPTWWVAFAEDIPGANTQGRTKKEALSNLEEAVGLLLNCRKEVWEKELPRNFERASIAISA